MSNIELPTKKCTVPPLRYSEELCYRMIWNVRPAPVATALKRLLRIKRQVFATETGIFFIDPVSNLGSSLLLSGEYEPDTLVSLRAALRPGAVFVDVGANEGYFTVAAARLVGSEGRVVAVEPQTRARSVLQRNLELNELHNVSVLTNAVSDKSGQATLYLTPDVNTGASGLSRRTTYNLPSETVPVLTLEACLSAAGLDKVDALKMDIEGFEHEAVLGSPEVFRQHRIGTLILEVHDAIIRDRGLAAGDITKFLNSCGYRQVGESRVWRS